MAKAATKATPSKALRELIDAKAKRRKPVEIGEEEQPSSGTKVIGLVDALKRSAKSSDCPAGGQRATSTHKRKAG